MNSEILDKINLNIDPAYYLIGLIIICIGLLVYIIVTNKKIKVLNIKYAKFMSGKDGKTLENVIARRFSEVDDLIEANKDIYLKLDDIKDNLQFVYQKLGIVKYDAFNEMGGKLSFALAILDKENTGFVINAIHSKEGCYTYVKEIIKGESYILLGEEEKEAVNKAINTDNFME